MKSLIPSGYSDNKPLLLLYYVILLYMLQISDRQLTVLYFKIGEVIIQTFPDELMLRFQSQFDLKSSAAS